MLACTIVALVWANSPWSQSYFDLWSTAVGFRVGDFEIVEPLQAWVNDLGMAIFFFVVGLEIKREMTMGELADKRAALLALGKAARVAPQDSELTDELQRLATEDGGRNRRVLQRLFAFASRADHLLDHHPFLFGRPYV